MASLTVQPLTATQTGGAQQVDLVTVPNQSQVQILVATYASESQTVNLVNV